MAIRIKRYKCMNGKIIMGAENITANGKQIKIIKNKFVLDKPDASLDNWLFSDLQADLKTLRRPQRIKDSDEYGA